MTPFFSLAVLKFPQVLSEALVGFTADNQLVCILTNFVQNLPHFVLCNLSLYSFRSSLANLHSDRSSNSGDPSPSFEYLQKLDQKPLSWATLTLTVTRILTMTLQCSKLRPVGRQMRPNLPTGDHFEKCDRHLAINHFG